MYLCTYINYSFMERAEYILNLIPSGFTPLDCIYGLEGMYGINSNGEIFSVRKLKILNPSDNGLGYHQVYITKYYGGGRWYKVHRLVAMQFIPNPFELTDVNHKDGIKNNNRVENLEWVSHSDNILHSYRVLGRVHIGTGSKKKCLCVTTGIEYSSMKSAADSNGCFLSNVSACCSGKIKSTNGLVFSKIIHD